MGYRFIEKRKWKLLDRRLGYRGFAPCGTHLRVHDLATSLGFLSHSAV